MALSEPRALVPIPLPPQVATELLAFIRDAKTGSLTLHFRSGDLMSTETTVLSRMQPTGS